MPPLIPDAGQHTISAPELLGQNRFPLIRDGRRDRGGLPLAGRHTSCAISRWRLPQRNNSTIRISISPQHIEQGIRKTRWRDDLEVKPGEAGFRKLFGRSHNPAGAWALRSALSTFYEDRPLDVRLWRMRDKAIQEIADILFPLAERVIATRADNPVRHRRRTSLNLDAIRKLDSCRGKRDGSAGMRRFWLAAKAWW